MVKTKEKKSQKEREREMSEVTAYLVFKPTNMGTFENHFHTDGGEPKDGHVMGFSKVRAKVPGWKLKSKGGQSVISTKFGVGMCEQSSLSQQTLI